MITSLFLDFSDRNNNAVINLIACMVAAVYFMLKWTFSDNEWHREDEKC